MKKITAFIGTVFIFQLLLAQPTGSQRIEDSVVGWKTIYRFKGKQYQPLVVDAQTFSPYQQSLRDSFITWMQRTYSPIGGWGDIYQRNYTSRQSVMPVPQSIGMTALFYGLYKNDRTGKYTLTPNEDHNDVFIYTNSLSGINNAELLSSSDGFYFTMLKNNYASTFSNPETIAATNVFGLHEGDRFSRYQVYFTGNNWVTVVLIPGNHIPVEQLTKADVLALCEKGIQRKAEEQKKDARHMSSNNPSYYAGIIKDVDEKWLPQCKKNLDLLKEKYKSRLNEPAELYGAAGPSFSDFASTSSVPTLFIEDWYQKIPGYPVYRYTKQAMEDSKKGKPLWIAITWQTQKPNTRVKAYEVHRAMLRYFNFGYVYDYFFNPEKVKGVAYTPANAGEQQARIQQLRNHYTVNDNSLLPQGVYFRDDFSGNSEGSRPAGWNDSRNRATAKVTSLAGKPGKWLQLGHQNELSAGGALKKPWPENFSLSFDVATDAFDVRTGGAVIARLSSYPVTADGWVAPQSKGTEITLAIEAGNEADYTNNNYRGGTETSVNSTIADYTGNFKNRYVLREFTNKKTMIHVQLKVKSGQATLFINNKEVAGPAGFKQDYCTECVYKGLPPGTQFRNLYFLNRTQNWSPDGISNAVNVYISNVTVTKE